MTDIAYMPQVTKMLLVLFITLFFYFITLITLSFYSFTQMDKGVIPVANFLSTFGLTQRTISGTIFIIILVSLTLCYVYFLKNFHKLRKSLWSIILLAAVISFPAFPAAFSRDVYNYAMSAKTVVVYGQNPWTTPPKAFPNDPFLNHLHWPNDGSRYGLTWTVPTTILYLLAGNNVGLSLYTFKLFTSLSWLGSLFLIGKIAKKINLDPVQAVAFLAFNPLLVIEFFIGTHTDITMTLFILLCLYWLFHRKRNWSLFSFFLSIGTKITSLPIIVGWWLSYVFHLNPKTTIFLFIWSAYLGTLVIISKWSINPWYFTLPIFLSALYLHSQFHRFLAISLSLAAAIRYAPLLFLGPFDPNNKIRAQLFLLFLVPFCLWVIKRLWRNYSTSKTLVSGKS